MRLNTALMNAFDHFAHLPDPRVERTKLYSMDALIFLTVSAVLCTCKAFTEIEHFAQLNLVWLQSHGHFKDGRIPTHDTLGRLFQRIDPDAFAQCFVHWVAQVTKIAPSELIAIDGKCLRGSRDRYSGKEAITLVSAWCNTNQLVLGQLKVADKSNEITAIPALLQVLDLAGSIVSIDAMGCQKDLTTLVRERKADYLFALKGNQPDLFKAVQLAFVNNKPTSTHEDHDKGHGRIEIRTCDVLPASILAHLALPWKDLRWLVRICSTRLKVLDGEPTEEVRFYISSHQAVAARFNTLVRQHWGIENSMHWVLDVTFAEDASRVRTGHADRNMATVRHTALNICRLDKTPAMSLKFKRMAAAYSTEFRDKLLRL